MSNTNKTPLALITGASRGLGAAMAEQLAPSHHILAVARTTGALEELDDRIKARGGVATLAPMDITVEPAMAQLCRSIHDRWGRIDLWIHTAIHAAVLTPVAHMDMKDWQKSVDINVTSLVRLIAYLTPLFDENSRAVFFDDPRGGEKFFGHYGTTKAAQMALVRSWQADTQRLGPRVDVLSPAPMATAPRARFFPGEDKGPLQSPQTEATRLLAMI